MRWGRVWVLGVVLLLALVSVEAYRTYRLLAGPAPAAVVEPEPMAASERAVRLGRVAGCRDSHGAHAYLGVPFAAPPIGPLRFAAPRSPRRRGPRRACALSRPPG